MTVVVIGGSGHIGTYLVPKLVREDHQVIIVSRGKVNRILGIGLGTRLSRSRWTAVRSRISQRKLQK